MSYVTSRQQLIISVSFRQLITTYRNFYISFAIQDQYLTKISYVCVTDEIEREKVSVCLKFL
jgi:hypothetical protein